MTPPTGDPSQDLLEHAERLWQAEEENARRLSRRVNLNLTIIAAVFGIGLFRLLQTQLGIEWLDWTVRFLLILSFVLLGVAALFLLDFFGDDESREEHPAMASSLLMLRGDEPAELAKLTAREARLDLFVKTNQAGRHLQDLNYDEQERINEGQQFMLLGFLSLLEVVVAVSLEPTESSPVAIGMMVVVLLLALGVWRNSAST